MKNGLLALALAAGFAAQSAQAQVLVPIRPGGTSRPTVSPYLNLNRGGPAGINYYSLVRPQFDANRNFQMLNQELQQLTPGGPDGTITTGTGATNVITTGVEGTGVPNYMYYSHYFPTMPAGGVNPFVRRR